MGVRCYRAYRRELKHLMKTPRSKLRGVFIYVLYPGSDVSHYHTP